MPIEAVLLARAMLDLRDPPGDPPCPVAVFQSNAPPWTDLDSLKPLRTTKGPITKIRLEPHTAASHIAILKNLWITHFLHFPNFSAQKIVAQEWSTGYGASEKTTPSESQWLLLSLVKRRSTEGWKVRWRTYPHGQYGDALGKTRGKSMGTESRA